MILVIMLVVKFFVWSFIAWLVLIFSGGLLGDPQVVLDELKSKQLVTTNTPDGQLFFGTDARLKAWAKSPNQEKIKLNSGQFIKLDEMYITSESNDPTLCQFVESQEDGNSLQINNVAIKMPFVFLFQNRGGSSALQTGVGNVLGLSGSPFLKIKEVFYTAAASNLDTSQKCKIILSNVKGQIAKCLKTDPNGYCPPTQLRVRYGIQGTEQLANVVFERPVAKLNICEKAVIAASYIEPLSAFSWPIHEKSRGTSQRAIDIVAAYRENNPEKADIIPADNCDSEINGVIKKEVSKKLQRPSNHWLPKAKKLILIGGSEHVNGDKFIRFHRDVTNSFNALLLANQNWSKDTLFDVTVYKNDAPYLHAGSPIFQLKGVDENKSTGSGAKLLTLHEMVSQKKDLSAAVTAMAIPGVEDKHHIVGKTLSLQSTYCHSYNEAVYAMTNNLDGARLKNSFEEAGFKTATANPSIAEIRVALSTERTNATSASLHHVAYKLIQLAKKDRLLRSIATSAAFGTPDDQVCSLSAAKDLLRQKQLYLAKTGTYDREGTITNKLAIWGWVENGITYTVVSRVIRPQGSGICLGSGCISQEKLLPLYRQIMNSI